MLRNDFIVFSCEIKINFLEYKLKIFKIFGNIYKIFFSLVLISKLFVNIFFFKICVCINE